MKHFDNFINGKFVPAGGQDRIEVTNPSTGALICTVPDSNGADVQSAIHAAEEATGAMGEAAGGGTREAIEGAGNEGKRER